MSTATQIAPPLRWRRVWWSLGILGAALVVALSLLPTIPDMGLDFDHADKLEHASAYFAMSSWFAGLLPRSRFWLLALLLLLLGASVEFAQLLMNVGREAEWLDELANASGVLAGLCLAAALRTSLLVQLERVLGIAR